MTVNLHKGPPPRVDVSTVYYKIGGRDFKLSAAEMFSFVPNPTRAKNAWPSSTCLLYDLPASKSLRFAPYTLNNRYINSYV